MGAIPSWSARQAKAVEKEYVRKVKEDHGDEGQRNGKDGENSAKHSCQQLGS
jgi:hypothetical protein